MFLKLFIAMGLTWILELIAVAISHCTEEGDVPQWVSIIINIANVLQGVIIFFVFGFKPSVRDSIRKKYGYGEQSSQSSQGHRRHKISRTESSNLNSMRKNSTSSLNSIRKSSTKNPPIMLKEVSFSPSNDGSDTEFIPSSDNEEA